MVKAPRLPLKLLVHLVMLDKVLHLALQPSAEKATIIAMEL